MGTSTPERVALVDPVAGVDPTPIYELVADPALALEMGRRARERVLDEHTYAHRARRLLELVGLGAGVAV